MQNRPSTSLLGWVVLAVLMMLGPDARAEHPMAGAGRNIAPPSSENWPITVGLQSESLGFYPARPHIAVSLGTEYVYVRRTHYDLLQMAELSYVRHRHILHGPSLDTGLLNRFKTNFGLYFDLGLKVGASWYRYPGTTYILDESSGEFVRGGNRGFWSLRVIPGLQIGVDLRRISRVPIKLLARYDQVVIVPFWEQDAPLLGQAIIGGGIVVSTNAVYWRRRR